MQNFPPKNKHFHALLKLTLVSLIFLISNGSLHAQSLSASQKHMVLYLKNGSMIRCTVLENKKDTLVKIQTTDRSIYVYKYEDVDKVIPESLSMLAFVPKTKGFYAAASLGGDFFNLTYHSYVAIGHRFNQYFDLGIFTGINKDQDGDIFCPVGVDLRGDFLNSRITPYYLLQAGFGNCINPYEGYTYKPGLFLHPAVGVKFNVGKVGLFAELFYEQQQLVDSYHNESKKTINQNLTYQSKGIGIGIIF